VNNWKELTRKYDLYRLTIKYWCQGDSWEDAVVNAKNIVMHWK